MIISKAPLRLTLGGGGTDLPFYAYKYGGFVVTSAINKYIYVLAHNRFEKNIQIKYSITELVDSINDIKHPVVREALKLFKINNIDIVSIADIPGETGLGSSSSFAVALLHALHLYSNEPITSNILAEESTNLLMEILKEPCGCQDTYISALGGFICLEINKFGVLVKPLKISEDIIRELENNLLFFYTGIKRSATSILTDQKIFSNVDEMNNIKNIGYEVKSALESGNLNKFAELQNEHWKAKIKTSKKIVNEQIQKWYEGGLKNGAIGGKLMGAGGGGFLMFYCNNDKDKLRSYMFKEGLEEVRFQFEPKGSRVIIDI